jgi:hypothetical protein
MQKIRQDIAADAEPEDLETCYILEKLVRGHRLPRLEDIHANHPTNNRWIRPNYDASQRALIARFRARLNAVETEETGSTLTMTKCIVCKESPFDAYLTSCMHALCFECFRSVNAEKRGTEGDTKCGCGAIVTEWAFYNVVESLRMTVPPCDIENGSGTGISDPDTTALDEHVDWVRSAGHLIQGAKLKAVRTCVLDWFEKEKTRNTNLKVVIFTQFLSMVDLLGGLCDSEGWKYKKVSTRCFLFLSCAAGSANVRPFLKLTGRTAPMDREGLITEFRDDREIRVLVSSLRAG